MTTLYADSPMVSRLSCLHILRYPALTVQSCKKISDLDLKDRDHLIDLDLLERAVIFNSSGQDRWNILIKLTRPRYAPCTEMPYKAGPKKHDSSLWP